MRTMQNLTVGWIASSVAAAVSSGYASLFRTVLITSVDSTTELPDSIIGKRIIALDPRCMFFGSGVIVPGSSIVRVTATLNLFNGFDELWCFDQPPPRPTPSELSLVGPLNIDADPMPSGLVDWMFESDCKLALGDGIGLNFAATNVDLAELVAGLGQRIPQ